MMNPSITNLVIDNEMKLTVQHHHVRSSDELDSLIENRILALQPRLHIEEALVRLECRFQESPAFAVRVQLVVPGPDLLVEGRDHTLKAAFAKVMQQLDEQIALRSRRRGRKVRSNLSAPASRTPGPSTH